MPGIELGELGFDRGGHLLIKRALLQVAPGETVTVGGSAPELALHLEAWCRMEGHRIRREGARWTIVAGEARVARWRNAERAGAVDPAGPDAVREHPAARWGLAARGALVEDGSPHFEFGLEEKAEVWSADVPRLYAQAAAAQWDPATAIPWETPFELDPDIEDAVVQVMTYLIENETAALLVPSRFVARLHPHFREVMQFLAIQAADEARHIEVFTRRASLKRAVLGLSTAGGQASLKTLTDEPSFPIASFLLSVMGEGTFLSLLWFIERHAPDPVTAAVARLAAQDEARHVAFGMAHLREHIAGDPAFVEVLAAAVRRRHDALRHTAGLNAEVFDALVLLASGSWDPQSIADGHARVMELVSEMDAARSRRLTRIGFPEDVAAGLSALHTRNFM